jgi:CrcB protein|tara:strand:- start:5438 stop:5803 length:366 start_codon:yes stop_codon:yes gene_type:complete
MKEIVLVGAGGFIGAALRYITSTWFTQFSRFGFPLGTLAVNFIGCTLLGLIIGFGLEKHTTIPLREFAVIGLLGGFTTFSAFGLESFEMLKAGQYKLTLIYISSSLILGILGVGFGFHFSR